MGSGIRKIWFNLALHWWTCVNLYKLFISKMLIYKMTVLILPSCLAHWTALEIEIIVWKAFRRAHDKVIVIILVPIIIEATPASRYFEVTSTGITCVLLGHVSSWLYKVSHRLPLGTPKGMLLLLITEGSLLQYGLYHVLPLLVGALRNVEGPWLETTITATYKAVCWYSQNPSSLKTQWCHTPSPEAGWLSTSHPQLLMRTIFSTSMCSSTLHRVQL